jgi:prolipoprotein diacylglyceryl transferase
VTSMILASIPSPSQGVWHIGPLPIRAYALCIVTGIIAALVIGDRRWVARGGEKGVIYDIALWAVPFGLVGGRLYHVMTDWSTYFTEGGAGFAGALRIWDGGLGIWGAVALGGVGAWIGCRVRGIPLPAFGDAIAPGIILAQAIGRLGNYFNQELYGRETDMPWGLIIYDRENAAGQRDMLNGVSTGVPLFEHPVHPTFLYELLWNLLVFALLLWADRRFRLGHGRLFALYVAAYCVGRFCVELMRSDYATLIAGIRVNTFTSTFVFIGAVIYIMAAKKGREDPESLRGKHADDDGDSDAPSEELVGVAAAGATTAAVAGAASSDDSSGAKPAEESDDEPAGEESDDAPSDDVPNDDVSADDAAPKSEVAAEAADLADAIEDVPDEELAEADRVAETIADAPPETEGLGAVDADEVADVEAVAPEAHQAAVEAADEAEAVADEVATEDDDADEGSGDVDSGDVDAETDEVETPDETDASASEDATESDVSDSDASTDADVSTDADASAVDTESGAVEGLGSVEGDEVEEAVEQADEVHDAAVESASDAEAVADDVATEDPAEPAEQAEPPKRWWRR